MKKELVIIYDYDGTLAEGNIQEPFLIPTLFPEYKDDVETFWKELHKYNNDADYDTNLMYMNRILQRANEKSFKLTHDFLKTCGSHSKLFKNVDTWFSRINEYARSKGVVVKHYIISSGNYELLEGVPIFKEFARVFACKFHFDANGSATAVARSVTAHNKLEWVESIRRNGQFNLAEEDLIPYPNMIFLGDGLSDKYAMQNIQNMGGKAYGIYSGQNDKALELYRQGYVQSVFPSSNCYKANSKLENAVKKVIDKIVYIANPDDDLQMNIFDFIDKENNVI